MYTERDLDELINEAIKDCSSLPYVCKFSSTESGFKRIFARIKQHIFERGIDDVDTALALVETELRQPPVEPAQ